MISSLLNPRRRLFAITVGILICLATFSTVQAKDNWTSMRTKNFTLIGNASEKDIRKVATRLEQFRDVFARLFPGAKFETPIPTTVIIEHSVRSRSLFALL